MNILLQLQTGWHGTYTGPMERLQAFQVAARVDGFIEVNEVEDGTALWFRNRLPDAGTNSHKRLCLATIYWQTVGAQFNSRTFRTVSSLQEWLRLHPHE